MNTCCAVELDPTPPFLGNPFNPTGSNDKTASGGKPATTDDDRVPPHAGGNRVHAVVGTGKTASGKRVTFVDVTSPDYNELEIIAAIEATEQKQTARASEVSPRADVVERQPTPQWCCNDNCSTCSSTACDSTKKSADCRASTPSLVSSIS